ncbi:MAG: AIPR family protein [Cyanobacteria bacterium P01_E01_bin.42]
MYGIGFTVNDRLLDAETENDLHQQFKNSGTLKVDFVFTQLKSSITFERPDILDTFEAVKDFFREEPKRQRNSKITNKAKLSQYLLQQWSNEIREKPKCSIYYITNARKEPSNAIKKESEVQKQNLEENCEINFDNIEIFTWGCDRLEKVYRSLNLQIETTVQILNSVDLVQGHPIDNIKQAISITLEFSEFKKIIVDEEDKMRPFIFYDNVRGFLGENNETNSAIKDTIVSENSSQFPILNNGITIIAKEVKRITTTLLRITDYQIVNGCQTSYVLFSCRNNEKIDEVVIPVKIIETDDEKIRGKIIKATNSQTAVEKELLAALSDFPQKLEDFYKYQNKYIDRQYQLHYERRPGQYNEFSEIKRKHIVSIWDQVKNFTSMFLDAPHLVVVHSRKQLVDKIPSDIFNVNHHPISYHVSSLAYFCIAKHEIPKQEKYHVLMLFKYFISVDCPSCNDNPHNNKNIENYCDEITKKVQKIMQCYQIVEKCKDHILKCYKIKNIDISSNSDRLRLLQSSTFTEFLLQEIGATNKNTKNHLQQSNISTSNQEIQQLYQRNREQQETLPLFRNQEIQEVKEGTTVAEFTRIESLNQKHLAKRLNINRSTISRKRKLTDFPEWSQRNDPDNIAWEYNEKKKLYFPVRN